jgi:hypothetical protein
MGRHVAKFGDRYATPLPGPSEWRSRPSSAPSQTGPLVVSRSATITAARTIVRFKASGESDNPVYLAGREHVYKGGAAGGMQLRSAKIDIALYVI